MYDDLPINEDTIAALCGRIENAPTEEAKLAELYKIHCDYRPEVFRAVLQELLS